MSNNDRAERILKLALMRCNLLHEEGVGIVSRKHIDLYLSRKNLENSADQVAQTLEFWDLQEQRLTTIKNYFRFRQQTKTSIGLHQSALTWFRKRGLPHSFSHGAFVAAGIGMGFHWMHVPRTYGVVFNLNTMTLNRVLRKIR